MLLCISDPTVGSSVIFIEFTALIALCEWCIAFNKSDFQTLFLPQLWQTVQKRRFNLILAEGQSGSGQQKRFKVC